MSQPQLAFAVPFDRPWQIRRPYVYRYLDKEFVDRFFEEGALRISSISQFSKHVDEERLDEREGQGVLINSTSSGGPNGDGITILASVATGSNCFVLCGSTRYCPELSSAFGANSGFRINDTVAFASAISFHIPRFRGGAEGSCLYADRKAVSRNIESISMESMKGPSGGDLEFPKLFQVVSDIDAGDLIFNKSRKYAHQSEYRMVWGSMGEVSGYIDIKCPEAIQFCTRFEKCIEIERGP